MTNAGASNRKEANPVYASAQKFVDSLKKSAVKTEPILHPDRVQRVNMESLLRKRFYIIVTFLFFFSLCTRLPGYSILVSSIFFPLFTQYRYRFQNLYRCSVLRIRVRDTE